MCFDDNSTYTPPPSAEESELRGQQLKLAREQAKLQSQLTPMLMDIMGYTMDEETGKVKKTGGEFEGTVSPAMERGLARQEKQVRESLSRKGGPDYELSTPGIQGLTSLRESQELQREESRRGSIALQSDIQNRRFAQGLGLAQPGNQLLSALSGTLVPYQQDRSAQQEQLNRQSQDDSAFWQGVGNIGYGILDKWL